MPAANLPAGKGMFFAMHARKRAAGLPLARTGKANAGSKSIKNVLKMENGRMGKNPGEMENK